MLAFAAATSPDAVSRVIWDAAYDSAAALDSADPNKPFSHAAKTVSPARSSMHDNAGSAALIGWADRLSTDALWPGPNPRMVAVAAMPIAHSVTTGRPAFAADFPCRNRAMRGISPRK